MEPQVNVMAGLVPCVTESMRYRTTLYFYGWPGTLRYGDALSPLLPEPG